MPPQRHFPFVQLDVFTSRPLEGNPLAVFPGAHGLSDAEMQAIAKEMNLSETTFILRREPHIERERGVRVRIFTVDQELPFAGHPTLGTAMVLRGSTGAEEVRLDLDAGQIPVTFTDGRDGKVFGEMLQRDPKFGSRHTREDVARLAGLEPEDIATDLPIETVSTGLPFIIVPLRSLAAARKLRLDWTRANEYADKSDGKFFYFVTRETMAPESFLHARMIFYNGEDPATGSAAGCAAAWMVAHRRLDSGKSATIEQGLEARRPSYIAVRADRDAGNRAVNVRVGGHAVEVLRGELFL